MTELLKDLNILQINLHRCRLAQDLMTQYAIEKGVNIVIISEPYRIQDTWYGDLNQDAAIWVIPTITGRGSKVQTITRSKGFVAIAIEEVKVFSCYISPNIPMSEFRTILNDLEKEVIKAGPNLSIIAGDLNAKALTWGSKHTDKSGYEILEMTARNNIKPVRRQGEFAFERSGHKSLIDVILCGKDCFAELEISEILDDYTASDHRYLRHVSKFKDKNKQDMQGTVQLTKTKVDINGFCDKYHEMLWTMDLSNVESPEDIDNYILKTTQLVKETSKKVHPKYNHKGATWWWNEDTAKGRKEVIRARRRFQRARAKRETIDKIDEVKSDYNGKKKSLKILISKAKSDTWSKFIETIDWDPWGKPCKWVVNKVKGRAPMIPPSGKQVEEAMDKLFVTKPQDEHETEEAYVPTGGVDGMDEDLSQEEVLKAAKMVKRKALGLDQIPSEVVWLLGKEALGSLTQVLKNCYRQGYFPRS
ncbi:uncharacterized protein LOC144477578 [Augochlora pura]